MNVGMIAAGAAAKECFTRLHLSGSLGPVAACSFRVASRIANGLRAGRPVRSYAEVGGANPILICVPDAGLAETVETLRSAGIAWVGQALLLYSTRRDSREIQPLRDAGAQAGSVRALEGVPGRFLVEGDRQAVAAARRLVQQAGGKAIDMDAGAAGAYLAAISFSSSLFTPAIEAAVECLRLAGASPTEAARMAEALFERALRAHRHGGRKSWAGPLAGGDAGEVARELEALEAHSPLLARHYREVCRFALELFGRHPELLERLRCASESSAGPQGKG